MRQSLLKLAMVFLLTALSCLSSSAQSTGRIQGTVRVASGAPIAGVTVVVRNQVTRKERRTRTASDGRYSLQLPEGAYRLSVATPNSALFDKDKNYGDFVIVKGDTLENVIVDAGKDTLVDIALAPETQTTSAQSRETPD